MIVAAGFSPSLDVTYLVDSLQLGEIHRPAEVVRCAGGKALNMARAAHVLGAEVAAVAILGGATASAVLTLLEVDGVRVLAVPSPAETRTCVSIASRDTGTLTEVYEHAPAVPPEVWRRFETTLSEAMSGRSGWLAICGSAPANLSPQALADVVQLGRRAGFRVALDTHGPGFFEAITAGPDLVKINRQEAAEFLSRASETELLTMATAIREQSAGVVVLTDGRAGALATDGQVSLQVETVGVEGHFPVGSGDSFLGGLLAALETDSPLEEALVSAVSAGGANAMVPGPGRFQRSAALLLAQRVTVRSLAR